MPESLKALTDDHEFDLHEAESFLDALDPAADTFTFQTFDDIQGRNDMALAEYFSGSLRGCGMKLMRRNRKGAGVFVTVNKLREGCARKNENVNRIRAVFMDLDAPILDRVIAETELNPHLIVQSSEDNHHVYWLVEPGLANHQFKEVQRTLADRFDQDQVNDPCRVMRLPGFIHQKDPDNPFRTRIEQLHDHDRFSPEEILEAFPPRYESTGNSSGENETLDSKSGKILLDMISVEFDDVDQAWGVEPDSELLQKARSAANGEKFRRLFDRGDQSGYESASEADMALVRMIAFWTGPRPRRIDKLFRQSALYRKKWDEPRGSMTWGESVILKALTRMDEDDFYKGKIKSDTPELPDLP
jgi:hypothetical protein